MDATTPPRGDDEPTGGQPPVPPALIEPGRHQGAGGSTATGARPGPAGHDPAPAGGGGPVALPDAVQGPEDPTVPDTAVEATLTAEPAGSRPDEPVVPTPNPEEVQVAAAPGLQPSGQPAPPPVGTDRDPDPALSAAPPREIVYVAAPTPPKNKGNRGIGVLIAAVSAFVFLFFYALVSLLIRSITRGDTRISFLSDGSFYIPVALFLVGFIVLVLIVNRAGWWSFVLGSLFVGAFVYFGTIGGLLLLQASILTPAAAGDQFRSFLINPLVIAAGLVAREVALWVGAGISARGRRVTARNAEARAEFEREQAERRAEIERDGAVVRPA